MIVLLTGLSFLLVAFAAAETDQSIADLQKLINQNGYHWTAGRTSVSEMPLDEFKKLLGHKPPHGYDQWLEKQPRLMASLNMTFPTYFDWRDSNGVTSVKNQGGCGSCWAFAATGAFEAAIKIHDGIEYDLSEQQVMSCNIYESGCGGGWAEPVYELFRRFGAVAESCMPYEAVDGIPCTQGSCSVVAKLKDWQYVDNDVAAIKQAVLSGPVYTSFSVYDDFRNYTSGCYQHTWGSYAGAHAVVIVGWDDNACGSGNGAWLCKNSWGDWWAGLGGYFWIKWNNCGIGSSTARPIYPPDPVTLSCVNHFSSEASGNGNGIFDPGETITISADLNNSGPATATSVVATLSTSCLGITVSSSQAVFPDIPSNETRTSLTPHFSVQIGAGVDPGTRIDFNLSIASDQGSFTSGFHEYVGKFDTAFFDNMDGSDNGWTHGGTLDDWTHGQPTGAGLTDPPSAYSGTNIWGNNLSGNYQDNANDYLLSPTIDCSHLKHTRLSFQRWLSAEKSIYDSSAIYVNNHLLWINDPDYDQIDTQWNRQDIDLSAYADLNSTVQLKFVLKSDAALHLGGWNIDDLAVTGIPDYLCGDANNDGNINVGDAIYIINHIFRMGPPPFPSETGDANGDGKLNVGDPVYIISYIFRGGPPPICQ